MKDIARRGLWLLMVIVVNSWIAQLNLHAPTAQIVTAAASAPDDVQGRAHAAIMKQACSSTFLESKHFIIVYRADECAAP